MSSPTLQEDHIVSPSEVLPPFAGSTDVVAPSPSPLLLPAAAGAAAADPRPKTPDPSSSHDTAGPRPERSRTIVQPEDDEEIRRAIHAAIIGNKRDQSKAKKTFTQVLTKAEGGERPAGSHIDLGKGSGDQSKSSKARAKLGRLLGRRPDPETLAEKGILADSSEDAAEKSADKRSGFGIRRRHTTVRASANQLEIPLFKPEISEPIMFFFVEQLLRFDAPSTEGIFRVSGKQDSSQHLLKNIHKFSAPGSPLFLSDEEYTVHDVSSAFKAYLRQAVEPLIPFQSMAPLVQTLEAPDHLRASSQAAVIAQFPAAHREGLVLLLKLCKAVAFHHETNLMSSHNIGIVFGPTIMREREETMDLSNAPADVVEDMIDHLDLLLICLSDVFPDAALVPFSTEASLPEFCNPSGSYLSLLPLPLPASFPSEEFSIGWFSSGDVQEVTISLLVGADPSTAQFWGFLAQSFPNQGSYHISSLPGQQLKELPLQTPLIAVIESSQDASLFSVSSSFVLEPVIPKLSSVFNGLASAELFKQQNSIQSLPLFQSDEILSFISQNPQLILDVVKNLSTYIPK